MGHNFNSLDGEKILITGGMGFVGSNLAIKCMDLGADVTIFVMDNKNIANIKEIDGKVKILYGDISNYKDVEKSVRDKDKVFHLAAQTSGITSMEDPRLDIRTNLIGTMNVLESCKKINSSAKLVFSGTITEAGVVGNLPLTGLERERPICIYDADKLICEKYASIYHKSYGLDTTCFRLSTLFGERQQINNPRFGITNYFIGRIIKKEPLIIYDKGEFIRDYIYIGDVVDAFLLSVHSANTKGEVFLLGSNMGMKFIDMAKGVIKAVEEIMGIKGEYKMVPFPKEHKKADVGNSIVSYTKFNEATGWKPKIDFEEGIRKTVAFYKERYKDYT